MSMMQPGDFAIVPGQFGWELIEVISTTARQFKGNKIGYSRYTRTVRMEDCSFFGSEAAVRLLHERLKSSDALCDEECKKSNERRVRRNTDLIAAAELSKTPSAPDNASNLSGASSEQTSPEHSDEG